MQDDVLVPAKQEVLTQDDKFSPPLFRVSKLVKSLRGVQNVGNSKWWSN